MSVVREGTRGYPFSPCPPACLPAASVDDARWRVARGRFPLAENVGQGAGGGGRARTCSAPRGEGGYRCAFRTGGVTSVVRISFHFQQRFENRRFHLLRRETVVSRTSDPIVFFRGLRRRARVIRTLKIERVRAGVCV